MKRQRAECSEGSSESADNVLLQEHIAIFDELRGQNVALLAENEELRRKVPRVTVINVETNEDEVILAHMQVAGERDNSGPALGSGLWAMAQAQEQVGLVLREVKVERAAALVEAAESRDRLECAVCMAAPRSCLYLPCAHLAVCEDCDKHIEQGNGPCPICGVSIAKRLHGIRLP